MSESPEKRKVIIDEDWKSRVQAEKEAIKEQGDQPSPAEDETQAEAGGSQDAQAGFPEASFSLLVTTLGTQALTALGQTAAPDSEKVTVDLNLARHLIDTLDLLEQKTQGNLTPDESQLLSRFLYELRMIFVAVQKHIAQGGAAAPGESS